MMTITAAVNAKRVYTTVHPISMNVMLKNENTIIKGLHVFPPKAKYAFPPPRRNKLIFSKLADFKIQV